MRSAVRCGRLQPSRLPLQGAMWTVCEVFVDRHLSILTPAKHFWEKERRPARRPPKISKKNVSYCGVVPVPWLPDSCFEPFSFIIFTEET